MSDKERELIVFNLCKCLVKLLGEEQAIADIAILYKRHPEMFRDKDEVREIVEKVVSEPDLIIKNPKAKSDKDFIAAKQLNNKKMGDIGIRNDNGTNVIYHANKQAKRNLNRFARKAVSGEAVHSLHTPSQAWMGGNDKSSGANTLSETTNCTIPQNAPQTTNKKKIFSKNPKPTQETREKLQAKMREVASKARESKHTKDKGAER